MTMSLTQEGCPFDPSKEIWKIRTSTKKIAFDFSAFDATQALRDSLRSACVKLLSSQMPDFTYDLFSSVRVFIDDAAARRGYPLEVIEAADYKSYEEQFSAATIHNLAKTLDALRRFSGAGFDALSDDLEQQLPLLHVAVPPGRRPRTSDVGLREH